jgi:hypothetical protein
MGVLLVKWRMVLTAALNRPLAKFVLWSWALVGVWDTFGAQLLPKESADKLPRIFDVAVMTGDLMPWYWWVIIGLIIAMAFILEYAAQRRPSAPEHRPTAGGKNELVPLHDAVMEGWEIIRKMPFLQKPSPIGHQTLLEYYESDPKKIPSLAAQVIFNHADPQIKIEGRSPPRVAREWIATSRAAEMRFTDDATVMFDSYDLRKPMEERRRYVELKVRSADVERRIKQMEEDD